MPGLVDSGADYSMFPEEWAQQLGIDLDDCLGHEGGTAGGLADRFLYEPGIYASVLGRKLHLAACFAPKCPVILLGREDFFRYFERISFDQPSETFEVEMATDWDAATKSAGEAIQKFAENVRKEIEFKRNLESAHSY